MKDRSEVVGVSTNSKGYFKITGLKPGIYYMEVDFIGYKKRIVSPVKLLLSKFNVNLGKILLQPVSLSVPSVKVSGEKPMLTYKIGKKVVYIGKNSTENIKYSY